MKTRQKIKEERYAKLLKIELSVWASFSLSNDCAHRFDRVSDYGIIYDTFVCNLCNLSTALPKVYCDG